MASSDTTQVTVEGRVLKLSNLSKILYPAAGFTKGDVISYYTKIAPVLLPHLADRPVTFVRYPDGVDGPSFFEKHVRKGAPSWLRTIKVPRTPRAKQGEYIEQPAIDDLASLVWAANLAALELHVPMWRSTRDGHFGHFDAMVFDLDPGPPADIVTCCRVALVLREELDARDLVAYPKTSGSKGLQLYVPLEPPRAADSVGPVALEIAQRVEAKLPDLVVTVMAKEVRAGKVFIDWGQNNPAKTTVAPYSLRARQRPTASAPIAWDELSDCESSGEPISYEAEEVLDRVAASGDLFGALNRAG